MPSLRDLGELETLRRLRAARGETAGVVVGPGDDAAVLAVGEGRELVATTDAFVEGGHFLPAWSPAEERGGRLAAAGLSDLAAMGAAPRWALLSMGLRPDHQVEALLAFQAGVAHALARYGAAIVGGNLTAVEGAEWFDLTLLGEVPSGRAWRRSGARAGDLVAVTGFPGRAGAGLRLVQALGEAARGDEWRPLLEAWLRPSPRVELALALAAASGVKAAMDVSDGLAATLDELCRASGVGVDLDASAWPADPALARAAARLGASAESLRLGPSDDYELVLAVAPHRRDVVAGLARTRGVTLSFVGRLTESSGRPVAGGAVGFDAFRPG